MADEPVAPTTDEEDVGPLLGFPDCPACKGKGGFQNFYWEKCRACEGIGSRPEDMDRATAEWAARRREWEAKRGKQ